MPKAGDLVQRPDFQIGELRISPSRRLVAGPEGEAHLPPLIMQVFLLLCDAAGKVVTRDELFDQCWGGIPVGDDSLNRSIARIRRTGEEVAPGYFEIETIPRTGYRLTGGILDQFERDELAPVPTAPAAVDRRAVIAGVVVLAAGAGAAAWWSSGRSEESDEAARLIEEGHQILRESVPRDEEAAIMKLRRAVELEPKNSQAWGLLALAYRARLENGEPKVVTEALRGSQMAANRALDLNPNNGDALSALAMLKPEFGNWQVAERQLRAALSKDADCVAAMNFLTLVLQSVGRATESFEWNEKAAQLDPLDVTPQYRLAIKQWIFNRVDAADIVLNRALQVWPDNPTLWNTRLMVLAYSDRSREAMRFLDQVVSEYPEYSRTAEMWRVSLRALEGDDPSARDRARESVRERASKSYGASMHGIMFLSHIGLLDDAFEVADGYYRWRGRLAGAEKTAPRETLVNDAAWRRTMALFTPATRAMRRDRRFAELSRAIGLTDYWRQTGTRPDAFLFR